MSWSGPKKFMIMIITIQFKNIFRNPIETNFCSAGLNAWDHIYMRLLVHLHIKLYDTHYKASFFNARDHIIDKRLGLFTCIIYDISDADHNFPLIKCLRTWEVLISWWTRKWGSQTISHYHDKNYFWDKNGDVIP